MTKIKWGIAGPGIIAHKFAEAIKAVDSAELVAVCSQTEGKAEAFAEEYRIPFVYSSYKEMADAPNVDAVYVSTAHPFHKSCAEVFLKAKKHVLCEKPMCINAEQAKCLKRIAEQNNVFLMEAMWTRFLPAITAAKKHVNDGKIGEIRSITADFCYSIEKEEDPKLFENRLAGGSLLDVGVYALHFADIFFEKYPDKIRALSNVENGVDLHTQMILKYDGGEIATLSSAIKLEKPFSAYIYGTKGRIFIPDFYKADRLIIEIGDEKTEESYPYGDNGFEFEIEEACRCISCGMMQSDVMPLSKTVEMIEQSDEIRRLIGLVYNDD